MTPPPLQSGLGPLHDLTVIQNHVRDPSYRFAPDIKKDIWESLGDIPIQECFEHVRRIVCSLTPSDYAGVDYWPDKPAGTVRADVYGKKDEHGSWYVKIGIRKELARIYSCHFLEADLTLKNGTVLRKQP
jgi:hypothetical protein